MHSPDLSLHLYIYVSLVVTALQLNLYSKDYKALSFLQHVDAFALTVNLGNLKNNDYFMPQTLGRGLP